MDHYEFEMFLEDIDVKDWELWDDNNHEPIMLIDVLKKFEVWYNERKAKEEKQTPTLAEPVK
ncbi:hypothetical protein SDC9_55030 [bioreactor metagenome]|uniref:Uncharacterized protein n=1 Tax=bioreactor metagenome TaxID=1076179 RepID=A0A644WXT9_9ZZZZ